MTIHHITTSLLVGIVLLIGFVETSTAEIPQVISYQGKVTDASGNPVADGNYTMRFWIYTAVTDGVLKWDSGARTVALADGVFSVLLGESPQPALTLSFSQDYWLAVRFAGVDQTPRHRIASAGYAYMASGLVPGTVVSGPVITETSAAIQAVNTAISGIGYGLRGESFSIGGVGVFGQAPYSGVVGTTTSTGGSDVEIAGVYGWTPSAQGYGVYGRATSTTGAAYGVYGRSVSTAGIGVVGWAGATTGSTNGVHGCSISPAGAGVVGQAAATTGGAHGVYGVSAASEGRGVTGIATATIGATYGVYGENHTDGAGVKGVATATGGNVSFGVYGESRSIYGRGVWGEATATTGTTYGGMFRTNSPDGVGIFARGGVNGYGGVFEGNVAIRSLTSGSIVLELGEGLDYAEGFNVSGSGEVGPGTVLVIGTDDAGKLSPSCKPYDTRVAGVVAGANGIGSGVRLGADQFDCDVALAGRVYCNADATKLGIEPGDLLTTSERTGYAMKASDHQRAQGAILGKAMERLEKGQKAQILVLVSLQ